MLESPGKCTGTWPTGSVWKDDENFQAGILHQQFFVQSSWDTKKFKAIASTCFFASGISCDRPNKAKLANEIKNLPFESRDMIVLKLSHEFTSEWRL